MNKFRKFVETFLKSFLLLLTFFIFNNANANQQTLEENFPSKSQLLKIQEDDHVMGCKDAPNVIIEYSSFACPHCASFHKQQFPEIKEKYIDTCKLKYVLRSFPTSISAFSATLLANCSKNYYESVDLLYNSQLNWAFAENYAIVLSDIFRLRNLLTKEEVEKCIANKKLGDQIKHKAYIANKVLKIEFIPIFFFNGEKISNDKTVVDYLKEKMI